MTASTAIRTVDGKTVPAAGTYEIDASHSTVEFVVRHLGLAKVRGRFNTFAGTIVVDDDVTASSVKVRIDAASIDTRDSGRDEHLRSPDFLNVAEHEALEFRSTGVRDVDGDWLVDGELFIAGTTRPVTLQVEFEGSETDPWGNARIGFSAETKVNREDFGLTWNQALESGGWLVGKEVKIELSVEAIRQDAS
ncbi:MAG TPA: YceI family protein [Egibacteraceae bacterium]|nr:YceI family protein [Egibacteraceae bacterium]